MGSLRRDGQDAELTPQIYLPAAQTGIYPVRLADVAVRGTGGTARARGARARRGRGDRPRAADLARDEPRRGARAQRRAAPLRARAAQRLRAHGALADGARHLRRRGLRRRPAHARARRAHGARRRRAAGSSASWCGACSARCSPASRSACRSPSSPRERWAGCCSRSHPTTRPRSRSCRSSCSSAGSRRGARPGAARDARRPGRRAALGVASGGQVLNSRSPEARASRFCNPDDRALTQDLTPSKKTNTIGAPDIQRRKRALIGTTVCALHASRRSSARAAWARSSAPRTRSSAATSRSRCCPRASRATPERLARFEREARVLASLSHPSIAGIHGLEHERRPALPRDGAGGRRDARRPAAARPARASQEAARLALRIAEALEAAHEKSVVHRDLKPGERHGGRRRSRQGARLRPGQGARHPPALRARRTPRPRTRPRSR